MADFSKIFPRRAKCSSEIMWKKCVKCFFSPNWFQVRLRQKNGFCVLVDVHEMALNRKVLCKQYARTEKYWSTQTLYGFFENFSDWSSHYMIYMRGLNRFSYRRIWLKKRTDCQFLRKIERIGGFENIVDCGSVANFGADSGLCLSYVRILGPKRNLDYRSFFSVHPNDFFYRTKLIKLRCDTVIERLELYCVIFIKHACCLLYY